MYLEYRPGENGPLGRAQGSGAGLEQVDIQRQEAEASIHSLVILPTTKRSAPSVGEEKEVETLCWLNTVACSEWEHLPHLFSLKNAQTVKIGCSISFKSSDKVFHDF